MLERVLDWVQKRSNLFADKTNNSCLLRKDQYCGGGESSCTNEWHRRDTQASLYFCKQNLREIVLAARYPARAHAEHRNGRDCGYVHLPRLRTNRQGWAFFDLPLALFVLPLPLALFCLPFFLPLAWIRCS